MEQGARVMRKSARPAGGTSEPCLRISDTRYYKGGWGCNGSNGDLLPGTILMRKTTPLLMIPGRNPKEVLDLPVHPQETSPGAPE